MPNNQNSIYDIFIIGGGINGAGIARDAAGRGYSVALAEMNDFGSATSSSSTKLFHGGLRYLEYLEFRLVKEALTERETLLKAMPHISWPMRFVLPFHKDMRFESNTPVSRLLSIIMPWAKGARPAWLIRTALFLYDHLGGRKILPGTKTINLKKDITGDAIDDRFLKAFEYSDCWVEDARLVILNAIDAKEKGATILARTKVESAKQVDGIWQIKSKDKNGKTKTHKAKMIVNAGGPWVGDLIHSKMHLKTNEGIRLVRGSHIITKRLFEHDKTYFFQGTDGRIIFAIPYEEDFTLIGTTDAEHDALSTKPECTPEEANYLVNFANNYFKKDISTKDIVWTYSGVRPLYDEGVENASAATREYVLRVNTSVGAPVLNIFGGKITTYRKLAESALQKIDDTLKVETKKWTAGVHLRGGDIPVDQMPMLTSKLAKQLPFLDAFTIRRLIRQFGTHATHIFANAKTLKDLGKDFGNGITGRELDYLIDHEWVHSAEDFLWRRSKMGLRVSKKQITQIEAYISKAIS